MIQYGKKEKKKIIMFQTKVLLIKSIGGLFYETESEIWTGLGQLDSLQLCQESMWHPKSHQLELFQ